MKPVYTDQQLDRIRQRITAYRAIKRRHLLQRAIKLWRRSEADRRLATLREPLERMH